MSLSALSKQLKEEYPLAFMGLIYFNPIIDSWQNEFLDILNINYPELVL